jgi:DNA-binding transcriptional LysR family regulator
MLSGTSEAFCKQPDFESMANTRYFEYALAVERCGSIKAAAAVCNVSQPALSKGIAVLEKEYGVPIFDRKSRPLITTAFGQSIMEEARRIQDGERKLRDHILQLKDLVNHNITVMWGAYTSRVILPGFTKAFTERFPNSRLVHNTCGWDSLESLYTNPNADLIVGDISFDSLEEDFVVTPLPPQEVMCICCPDHPLTKKKQVTIRDVFTHPLVHCYLPPWAREAFSTYMEDFDHRDSPASICVNDFRIMHDILLQDPEFVTFAPISCFKAEIADKKLVALPVEQTLMTHAGVVYPKRGSHSPILPQVIEMVESVLAAS